jgi:hypothetical protein
LKEFAPDSTAGLGEAAGVGWLDFAGRVRHTLRALRIFGEGR